MWNGTLYHHIIIIRRNSIGICVCFKVFGISIYSGWKEKINNHINKNFFVFFFCVCFEKFFFFLSRWVIEWKNCYNFFLIHEQKSAEIFSDNRRNCDINQLGTAQTKRLFFCYFVGIFDRLNGDQRISIGQFQIFFFELTKKKKHKLGENKKWDFRPYENKKKNRVLYSEICFFVFKDIWHFERQREGL